VLDDGFDGGTVVSHGFAPAEESETKTILQDAIPK
jgi:hypothetical protein